MATSATFSPHESGPYNHLPNIRHVIGFNGFFDKERLGRGSLHQGDIPVLIFLFSAIYSSLPNWVL
jgi:hypothetical protein